MPAWFQASAEKQIRKAFFCVITQRVVVIFTDIAGQVEESETFDFFNPKDGTDKLSRNVGKNYHYSLRNNLAERSYRRQICLSVSL